jgi:hypothetical protein
MFNATFQTGCAQPGSVDATYAWTAAQTGLAGGDYQVQITCSYGGGGGTTIIAQTEPIPWGSGGPSAAYPISTQPADPQIGVNGTIVVTFDETPGSEFIAVFNGTMSLVQGAFNANSQAEVISTTAANGLIVAAQLTGSGS